MRKWAKVTDKYMGQQFGDRQNPDEPGDGHVSPESQRIAGKGAQGGGSKPTPQVRAKGSVNAKPGSYPRNPQKIRG